MRPTRREFIAATTTLAPLFMLGAAGCRSASSGSDAETQPWFEVSLAQWSNHRSLNGGQQTHMEWLSSVRSKYDIHAVEFVNQFFPDKAGDWQYLDEMKLRAADAGTKMLLIMIDGEGALAAESDEERAQAIENHHKWVVAASYLGCHSIRVNAAGGGDSAEMQKRAADSLVQLAAYAASYKINVIVENHGGRSSDGKWLSGVMQMAGNPQVGTLPDFGNFKTGPDTWYDRYQGVRDLMPYAKAVSAKSHEFDGDGNELYTDYMKMLLIVRDAGYRGHVGIEYEGSKHNENQGIQLTHDLLLRVRKALS